MVRHKRADETNRAEKTDMRIQIDLASATVLKEKKLHSLLSLRG